MEQLEIAKYSNIKTIYINYIDDFETLREFGNYCVWLKRDLDFDDITSYSNERFFFDYQSRKPDKGFETIVYDKYGYENIVIFNGNNFKIKNLYISNITHPMTYLGAGLFYGEDSSFVIRDLVMSDVYIEGESDVSLVSRCKNVVIDNVSVSGIIKGLSHVGGFVGCQGPGQGRAIIHSVVMDALVSGKLCVGGLAGYCHSVQTQNTCIAKSVIGTDPKYFDKTVGVFVGSNDSGCFSINKSFLTSEGKILKMENK